MSIEQHAQSRRRASCCRTEHEVKIAGEETAYDPPIGPVEDSRLPLIYPAGLTRHVQIVLAVGVVAINLVMYGWLLGRHRERDQA